MSPQRAYKRVFRLHHHHRPKQSWKHTNRKKKKRKTFYYCVFQDEFVTPASSSLGKMIVSFMEKLFSERNNITIALSFSRVETSVIFFFFLSLLLRNQFFSQQFCISNFIFEFLFIPLTATIPSQYKSAIIFRKGGKKPNKKQTIFCEICVRRIRNYSLENNEPTKILLKEKRKSNTKDKFLVRLYSYLRRAAGTLRFTVIIKQLLSFHLM